MEKGRYRLLARVVVHGESRNRGRVFGGRLVFLLVVLLLLFPAPGCVLLPTFTGPPARPSGMSSPFDDDYRDFKGVIHCHSKYSHDSDGSQREIIRAARRVGMDFLIMTDHASVQAIPRGLKGWHDGVLFLIGAELSQGGSRSPLGDWSVLALDIERFIEQNQPSQQVIDEINGQGGLAFVGHMESVQSWHFRDYHGVEIYNVHADMEEESYFWLALKGLFFPPNWFFSTSIDRPDGNLARWDMLTQQRKVVAIGGNDAHANVNLFFGRAGTVGTYEQMFKLVSTHVLAKKLNPQTLKESLSRGRCYISLDVFGDGTGFRFFAQDGQDRAIMGDEIGWTSDLDLQVFSPARGLVQVFRSGRLVHQAEGQWIGFRPPGPGVYRVEVQRRGKPWIFSNPIYVR